MTEADVIAHWRKRAWENLDDAELQEALAAFQFSQQAYQLIVNPLEEGNSRDGLCSEVRRRIEEILRITDAMKRETGNPTLFIGRWLEMPSELYSGRSPLDLIKAGTSNHLWENNPILQRFGEKHPGGK